ncbi:bacteriophage abortive infection AbiH family protein [Lysinibacillus capsici]|uniref:bacteriophage abortive infection AbiH family protein n=1 Tax=Lysinibacillus capsici TaxID=2115968 RepID=UPI0027315CF3|nr:bacteriophage abortive infection AbiH family protein [Lysinibacillus capsici]MDP1393752.1 bacteriophage abortive infection AbiH family protein [Lysinibacillus capsici]MDP1414049.1 bacteriophage abortive infection AbiH family protein [Lysinibacillus capsici]MDP1429938.1 bacteriophage abortive infection AbiH family protein [Lysinibacillus capsici]
MNLFIIGNGFDLAHGMPTKYWNFREFLKIHHPFFLDDFEKKYYLNFNDENALWANLEFNLANIQDDVLIEEMYQDTDLGLDSGNTGIQDTLIYHFESQFEYIENLTIYLEEWIKEANETLCDITRGTSLINRESNDIFINFNYTTVLEEIYKINDSKILHLHGTVNEGDLVLGHSNYDKIAYFNGKYVEADNRFDEQFSPIYLTIRSYLSSTYKNVQRYMFSLNKFNYTSVDNIYIIGHSLSEVDLPYFMEIKQKVNEDVSWIISYRDEQSLTLLKDSLIKIGIKDKQIKTIHSSEFFDLTNADQTERIGN